MARTVLMHAAIRCPEDTISTDLWPMAMDYTVWVYNRTPDMKTGLSTIEIWSRSRFEPVSKTLSNCQVWSFPKYVLEPKLQKPGVKIPKLAPRSQRGVNMGFVEIHSTQVGLVLNLLAGSISPHYHVLFDDMFSTVMNSTTADPEVWINLVTPSNSRIQVMLYQEDDPELDDEWLTADEQLTRFSKSREQTVGRVKVTESPSVQGPQSSEEDLFVRERVTSSNERPSVIEPGTNGNHSPIGQAQNDGSSANSQNIMVQWTMCV